MIDLSNRFPLRNILVDKVYIFGGQVLKVATNDVDLLVISDDFVGMSRLKRIEKVCINFDSENIDPVCLTTVEYERLVNQGSTFLNNILSTCKKIYDRGDR